MKPTPTPEKPPKVVDGSAAALDVIERCVRQCMSLYPDALKTTMEAIGYLRKY